MDKYLCEICGKKHNVFRILESPLPDLITEIPEEERDSRVEEVVGLYLVDRKWLLGNGYLYIELENLNDPIFYWQVWVSISPKDFQNCFEQLKVTDSVELNGVLQSELPFYPKSRGLEVKVQIHATNEFHLEIIVEEDSKLRDDQSKPITRERVIELMQFLNHNELFRKEKKYDNTFGERLKEELNYVEDKYIKKKKGFSINISSPNSVLFQIVSSEILEMNKNLQSGFGLHLSFDNSLEESKEEINKFRKQDYAKGFKYYELDGIPVYQIDLGIDKKRVGELVNFLIEDVYEQDIETIDIDSFEL
jgi:hypothetical protein